MLNFELGPLDVIVFKGTWYKPTEGLVMWRSLSQYSHCVTALGRGFQVFDANTDGLHIRDISYFAGREATICRFKNIDKIDLPMLASWAEAKFNAAKGYDYLSWLGFATGCKEIQDENRWFCSELPYWCFTENGVNISNKELTFMYPSFFVYNPLFEIIFEGKI